MVVSPKCMCVCVRVLGAPRTLRSRPWRPGSSPPPPTSPARRATRDTPRPHSLVNHTQMISYICLFASNLAGLNSFILGDLYLLTYYTYFYWLTLSSDPRFYLKKKFSFLKAIKEKREREFSFFVNVNYRDVN